MKTCKQCGSINADDAKFCTNCGTPFEAETDKPIQEESPSKSESSLSSATAQPVQEDMGFVDAIKICFKKYATFKGRATRAEFWSFSMLFSFVVAIPVLFLSSSPNNTIGVVLLYAVLLPLLCPMLAVAVRRLHDSGLSAWWLLLGLIPYLGGLIFFWYSIKESEEKDNKYGAFVNYKVKRSFYIALVLWIAIEILGIIISINSINKTINDISQYNNEYVNMNDDTSATTRLEEEVKERFDEIYEEDSLSATEVCLNQVDDSTYNGTIYINGYQESLPIIVHYDGYEINFDILEQ